MLLVVEEAVEEHQADDGAGQHGHAHEEALVRAAAVHREVVVGPHSRAALPPVLDEGAVQVYYGFLETLFKMLEM